MKRVISFLMYDVQKTKGKAWEASIYRFMIDRKHQGRVCGRAALSKALEEIRALLRVDRISIRCMLENPVAKPFYATFGFVEAGLRLRDDRCSEAVMSDGMVDPLLQLAIYALSVPGLLISHCVISQRDELEHLH